MWNVFDGQANGRWFLLCLTLMLLWVIGTGLEKTSTVSEKSLGLFQDYVNEIIIC